MREGSSAGAARHRQREGRAHFDGHHDPGRHRGERAGRPRPGRVRPDLRSQRAGGLTQLHRRVASRRGLHEAQDLAEVGADVRERHGLLRDECRRGRGRARASSRSGSTSNPSSRPARSRASRPRLSKIGRRQRAAAFNAANYYATGGEFAKAKVLIEVAAKDPSLADKVAVLRDWSEGQVSAVWHNSALCLFTRISRRPSATSRSSCSTPRRRRPSPTSSAWPKAPRSGSTRRPGEATRSRSTTASSFTASSAAS